MRDKVHGFMFYTLMEKTKILNMDRINRLAPSRAGLAKTLTGMAVSAALTQTALASEDTPRRPFAEWADVPAEGQLVWGTFYEQSEAYYIWAGSERHGITIHASNGESYGIDVRQGYFTLDYGLTERWAADVNFGATTVGWRAFGAGAIGQTTGTMDSTFGARYQLLNETKDKDLWPWVPTLTFRAAGIVPGSYSQNVAFAPGNHSAGIEPSLLFRKHLGWPGFGVWGDALYRWEHTITTDQYIAAAGVFQQIKGWELDVGYRHLQATSGSDIVLIGPVPAPGQGWNGITYQANVKEISESIDAGFSYTTVKRHIRWAFHSRKTFDGRNTDSALWLGGSVDIPFDYPFGIGKKTD